jgi:hypothetical protein
MPRNTDANNQPADDEYHDLSPWAITNRSTRVHAYRYDHATNQLQVKWQNNKNRGYLYEDVTYEDYRSFARAASLGKRVNDPLTYSGKHPYRLMTDHEANMPSNPNRMGMRSRVKDDVVFESDWSGRDWGPKSSPSN